MIPFYRFNRALTVFLCLLYIFTGSGLDKMTYQCVSLIQRSVVFPCKGKGCQCDKAGYELLNCQCDHENNISCCSLEEEIVIEEETCCSEKEQDLSCGSISQLPCQGVEDEIINSLAKHLLFLPHFEKVKDIQTSSLYISYTATIKEAEVLPLDKVPIYS